MRNDGTNENFLVHNNDILRHCFYIWKIFNAYRYWAKPLAYYQSVEEFQLFGYENE